MKKIFLFILFTFSIYLSCFAQQDYTVINFIAGSRYKHTVFKLYINDQLIGSINGTQTLEYKCSAKGPLNYSALVDGHLYTNTIEIENKKIIFYSCSYNKVLDGTKDEKLITQLMELSPEKVQSLNNKNGAENVQIDSTICKVYFIGNGPKNNYSIYLNDHLIANINDEEILEYKMHSTGRISILIVSNIYRHVSSIDSKPGETIFYQCAQNKIIGNDKGNAMLSNSHIVQMEETSQKPIGQWIEKDQEKKEKKQGTCFLIDERGYLLTNYHVISGAQSIKISGIGNDFSTLFAADVLAVDVYLDLALLKIKNTSIQFSPIPYSLNSTIFSQGSKAFVLGYPMTSFMGEEIKLTDGIISAKSGYKGTISHYQFSAPVQPGNSGSPLFNDNGELIAIINSKIIEAEGVGYAIKGKYMEAFIQLTDMDIHLGGKSNTLSSLSLSEKAALLKNYIFIVHSE